MKTFPLYLLAITSLLFVTSCMDDDDPINPAVELEVPATYEFTRDGASTVSFSGQTTRIAMAEELVAAMLDNNRTTQELVDMFRNPEGVDPFESPALNEATKSIRSKVAAGSRIYGQDAVRAAAIRDNFDGLNGWIVKQVEEVFPAWNELAAPGQPGQIADGSSVRYINGWGLEYNQAVAKSLIGAMMLDQISNQYLFNGLPGMTSRQRANDSLTMVEGQSYTELEHHWDEAFGYLFGASATPVTPLIDLEIADNFLNKYLGRVEGDEDYAGIAEEIELSFRTGRQAIVQQLYQERSLEAISIYRRLEDVIAIRSVYYLKQAEIALRAEPARRGEAFHDLSEGYGFIYSLRFFNRTSITGLEIDWFTHSETYLTTLRNAEGNGWWDINPDVLATLAEDIASMTGISVAEAGS